MRDLLRTTAVVVGATGATVGAAYGVLSQHGRRARRSIVIRAGLRSGRMANTCPTAPGHRPSTRSPGEVVRLAMPGDFLAAGLGVDGPGQLPGVVLARGWRITPASQSS